MSQFSSTSINQINISWLFSEDPGVDDPVGEVSVQVDLFTHPGTGEHKVAVKGMDISLLNVIFTCNNPLNLHNLPFIVWQLNSSDVYYFIALQLLLPRT